MRLLLMAIALAFGCGASKAPKQSPTSQAPESTPAQANVPVKPSPDVALLKLFDELDSDIAATHADCTMFALVLSGWLSENGVYYQELTDSAQQDLDPGAIEAIDAEISAHAVTVVFAASECGHDNAALAAYDEFDALVL